LLFGGRQAGGEDFMITRTVNVKMSKNLSASPAALLVQKASKYDSIIYIESGERKVNAKSIMGMMSITIDEGDELMIKCDGSDENDAMSAMEGFLTGAMA
jgi:catabolite repression HPr-like protein